MDERTRFLCYCVLGIVASVAVVSYAAVRIATGERSAELLALASAALGHVAEGLSAH